MFYKYEFPDKKTADGLIDKLKISDFKSVGVARLGFILIKPNTFTKGGKPRKDAVFSTKYSVDAIFEPEQPKEWAKYQIKLGDKPNSHNFAGVKYSE